MSKLEYINHSDGNLLVKDGNILYVLCVYNFRGCIGGQPDSDKAWYVSQLECMRSEPIEDDEDGIDMKVELKGENRFILHDAHELWQFNCCNSLFAQIKILASYLKSIGYSCDVFDRFMDDPSALPEAKTSNVTVTEEHLMELSGNPKHVYKIDFSFDYAGKRFDGSNSFCKYSFIENLIKEIDSIDQLFKAYVAINRLLADLCRQYEDDDFLSCDDWARVG